MAEIHEQYEINPQIHPAVNFSYKTEALNSCTGEGNMV